MRGHRKICSKSYAKSSLSRFCLNGFRVEFSKSEFGVFCAEFDEPDAIRNLRAELGSEWFFYRRGNWIYGLPQTRTKVLNGDLEETFRRWYPAFRSKTEAQAG
jgi:hypothetical protein